MFDNNDTRLNTSTPWHDPVVAEIHATRERLADQYHNDLLAYSNAAEARCRALGLTMAQDQHRHIASLIQQVAGSGLPVTTEI